MQDFFHPGKHNFFNYVQKTRKVQYGQISLRYFSLLCNHTLQLTGAGTGGLYFFLSYPCISFIPVVYCYNLLDTANLLPSFGNGWNHT